MLDVDGYKERFNAKNTYTDEFERRMFKLHSGITRAGCVSEISTPQNTGLSETNVPPVRETKRVDETVSIRNAGSKRVKSPSL